MTERDTLKQLIDDDVVAMVLRKQSRARHAVESLQTLLHWLKLLLAWRSLIFSKHSPSNISRVE